MPRDFEAVIFMLKLLHTEYPRMTVCQMIAYALGDGDHFYTTDAELSAALAEYAMKEA